MASPAPRSPPGTTVEGGSRRRPLDPRWACYILQQEKPYQELGGDNLMHRENTERVTRRLVRQLERVGQRTAPEPALEAR